MLAGNGPEKRSSRSVRCPTGPLPKKVHRTKWAVGNKRLRLGIPRCYGDHYRPWTKKETALLGKYSDREVARMVGKSYAAVLGRRRGLKIPNRHALVRPWTKEELAILRKIKSHAEVARLVNRTMEAVSQKRDRLTRERKRRKS